jgi:hypothetical protein
VLSGDTTLRVDAGEPRPELPHELAVNVFPNPFNSTTTIVLEVPVGMDKVELVTYNVLGQIVRSQEMRVRAGTMQFGYDAADLATGIYLLRATAGRFSSVQKMVVLR